MNPDDQVDTGPLIERVVLVRGASNSQKGPYTQKVLSADRGPLAVRGAKVVRRIPYCQIGLYKHIRVERLDPHKRLLKVRLAQTVRMSMEP